jgi:hypothetical protein
MRVEIVGKVTADGLGKWFNARHYCLDLQTGCGMLSPPSRSSVLDSQNRIVQLLCYSLFRFRGR